MIRKATPAAKLITAKNPITSIKPVRLSERCGVSRAENSTGSGASGSKPLPVVMTYQYIPFMAKIIRAQRAKKALVRSLPKKSAKAKSKAKSKAQTKPSRPAKKSGKKSKPSKTMVSKPNVSKPNVSRPNVSRPNVSRPWTPAEVREVFERFQKAN